MDAIRVAVTGAAGQIGSALARQMLNRENIRPIALCRNAVSAGLIEYIAPGCEVRVGSITDPESARQLLKDCDAVIHCALAIVSRKPQTSRKLNRAMIENIAQLNNLKIAVHLSTVSVYGSTYNQDRMFPGTFERPRPDDEYGRSKLALERLVQQSWNGEGRRWFVLRVGHVIGANLDHSRSIIELATEGRFRLPFDGAMPSNTIHVEKLAAQILFLLVSAVPSGVFNAVDESATWREVFDWHTDALGLPKVQGLPTKPSADWGRQYRSNSIMRDVIGWARTLGLLDLVRYPAVLQGVTRIVRPLPESLIDQMASWYKRKFVKGQIASSMPIEKPEIAPLLVSDAVPGPMLSSVIDSETKGPSEAQMRVALTRWVDRFSRPTWLRDDSHRLPEP